MRSAYCFHVRHPGEMTPAAYARRWARSPPRSATRGSRLLYRCRRRLSASSYPAHWSRLPLGSSYLSDSDPRHRRFREPCRSAFFRAVVRAPARALCPSTASLTRGASIGADGERLYLNDGAYCHCSNARASRHSVALPRSTFARAGQPGRADAFNSTPDLWTTWDHMAGPFLCPPTCCRDLVEIGMLAPYAAGADAQHRVQRLRIGRDR